MQTRTILSSVLSVIFCLLLVNSSYCAVPEYNNDCATCISFVRAVYSQGYRFSTDNDAILAFMHASPQYSVLYTKHDETTLMFSLRLAEDSDDTVTGCRGYICMVCDETTCNNDGVNWTSGNTGYMTKPNYTCNDDLWLCENHPSYQCAAGYYGSSTNGTSGCSECPSGGTSPAGTTTQSGCYTTSGSDTSGSYIFKSNCYYN